MVITRSNKETHPTYTHPTTKAQRRELITLSRTWDRLHGNAPLPDDCIPAHYTREELDAVLARIKAILGAQ